ncbi:MAG: VWA domain-containing protein [Terriglobales bacterium]
MFTHSHIRYVLLALLLLTCASAAQPAGGRGPDDSPGLPTYRSTVSEVRVTFFATGESNRPIDVLTQSDFAIVDNEQVVRNFRSLAHSTETSLDVVVLVDLSESVAPRVRAALSDVLQLVAREQSIAADNISVLSFGGTSAGSLDGSLGANPGRMSRSAAASILPAVLCADGCRSSSSAAKLQALKSGGATPLYDAIIFAADFLSQHRRAADRDTVRPVLILYSDGFDTISPHSASDALQAAQDAGVLIYSVDMGRVENSSGSAFLRQVSEGTGGRYFPRFSSLDGAVAVLNAALEDLRASYVVTYDLPSHQAGFHSLRLLPTHNLNLTFHSRNGYEYDYEPGGH